MGAYFKCYKKGDFIEKTLLKKKSGSPYPDIDEFTSKIDSLKYLGDFIAKTEIHYDGKRIRLKQEKVKGEDLFIFLNKHGSSKLQQFSLFLRKLDELYKKTGILPDLLNRRNVLVSRNNKIKIIDVWPLFFEERIKSGDINQESYKENLERFATLKSMLN